MKIGFFFLPNCLRCSYLHSCEDAKEERKTCLELYQSVYIEMAVCLFVSYFVEWLPKGMYRS